MTPQHIPLSTTTISTWWSTVGNQRRLPEVVTCDTNAEPHCRPTRAHPLLLGAEEREKPQPTNDDRTCNQVCFEGLLSGLLLAKPENSVACKVHTFLLHSLILWNSQHCTRIPNLSTKKLKSLKQLSAPNKIQVSIQTMNRLTYVKVSTTSLSSCCKNFHFHLPQKRVELPTHR